MARLHSSLGDRTVYTVAGLAKAQGLPAKVYEDPQGTVLANLAVYDPTDADTPGAAIPGAALTVDAFSNRPAFWDLNDRDALYITVSGGPLEPIRPDAQPQVTALAARVGTVEGVAAAAETPAGAQAKADAAQATAAGALAAHEADTTAVHGIPDTAVLVVTTDPRLSNSRTPIAHAATHQPGGTDAMTVDAAAGVGSLRTLGTGATQAAVGADAVRRQLVDAKGDLIVGTADDTVARLPVGADRRVPVADSAQPTGIRWTDPLGLEYVTTSINGALGTGSNAWAVANDARYARVLGSGTISKIGLEVTTQSGSVSVAVYSKTGTGINARPGARIATSGAIACPPVGYVEISLGGNVDVSDGDYLALSCDNTTAAFRGASGSVNLLATVISYAQTTAHPLPSAATPGASASRIPLLIGIP